MLQSYLNRLTLSAYRPSTVTMRRRVLSHFERSLTPRSLADATRHDCEAFLARPLAPGSRRVYRSALRHFYAWTVEEELLTVNPAAKVPPIRVKHGTPRPVSEDGLSRALDRADSRMRAWLLLMALAGMRCMEVAALIPADLVRVEDGWLLMLRETKGGGSAVVPCHTVLVAALLALPVHAGGTWWSVGSVQVSRQVGRHLRACGVNATAHQLRHTAATAWLRASGHDLVTTASLMRHTSVQTTQGYAALDPVRPAQVVGLVRIAG